MAGRGISRRSLGRGCWCMAAFLTIRGLWPLSLRLVNYSPCLDDHSDSSIYNGPGGLMHRELKFLFCFALFALLCALAYLRKY